MPAPRHRVFLAPFAALLLAGCASSPPADAPAEARVAPDSRGVQRMSVTAGAYWFRPSRIVVKAGAPVELTLRREGMIPHTFTLSAPQGGISADVALSSEPTVVSFTPRVPGIYTFICKEKFLFFASHLEQGMRGTLEVLP